MKRCVPCTVVSLLLVTFLAFQCQSGILGRVIRVNGNVVTLVLRDPNNVKVGEEFSLWRDREIQGSTRTYRSGIITIVKLFSSDSAQAILTNGGAEAGDKVTKWLISQ